jgi:hypothetical protein
MKNLITTLALSLIALSCNEDKVVPQNGTVQFNYLSNVGGRLGESLIPAAVLISIKNSNGDFVEQNKVLPLYGFGSGYVSEGIELPFGKYSLTQFIILDTDNHAIYATPIEGSEFAELVSDPLPIEFSITKNGNTLVTPQVLLLDDNVTPEKFGYVSFGFEVVNSKKLRVTFKINSVGDTIQRNDYSYDYLGRLSVIRKFIDKDYQLAGFEMLVEYMYTYEHGRLHSIDISGGGPNPIQLLYIYTGDKITDMEFIWGGTKWWYSHFIYESELIIQYRYDHVDQLSYKAVFKIESGNVTEITRYYGNNEELESHYMLEYDGKKNPLLDSSFFEYDNPYTFHDKIFSEASRFGFVSNNNCSRIEIIATSGYVNPHTVLIEQTYNSYGYPLMRKYLESPTDFFTWTYEYW